MRFAFYRRLFVVAAFAMLLLAAPAFAADAHGGGEKKGILDKLEFTGIKRYDLGIYTLIVFGLLMFVLSKFAWPKMREGLQKREALIIGARDEAQTAKAEAEALRVKLQKEYADAQGQIRTLIEEARRDADALRTKEREAGAKEAAAERDRAKRDIENAKDVALDEIYKKAVDIATMLSAKTLSRQISADDHRKLLDESLAELKQSGK